MNKRERVIAAFEHREVDRVPAGFWFHFLPDKFDSNPEQIKKNIEGHRKYYKDFDPDFLKMMSDGFFTYPSEEAKNLKTPEDLYKIHTLTDDDWFIRQAELVRTIVNEYKDEVCVFYNIFSPHTYLKLILRENKNPYCMGKLINENPDAVRYALTEIGKDVKKLIKYILTDGGADGIFFSSKNILVEDLTKEQYREIITPIEHDMLNEAAKYAKYNILHICGFERYKNDLSIFTDYPVPAVNWPVVVDGVSLEDGRKLFGGKTVIGGFDNIPEAILYSGTEEEIKSETKRILKAAGDTRGIILGADCTVPGTISPDHIKWVREGAKEFAENK